jgi:hypothetical protein
MVCFARRSNARELKYQWQIKKMMQLQESSGLKRLMKELGMDGTVDIVYADGVKATEDFRGTVDNERFFRQPRVGDTAAGWPDPPAPRPHTALPIDGHWMTGLPPTILLVASTCRGSQPGFLEECRDEGVRTGMKLYIGNITTMVSRSADLEWLLREDGSINLGDPAVFGFVWRIMSAHRLWRIHDRYRRGRGQR